MLAGHPAISAAAHHRPRREAPRASARSSPPSGDCCARCARGATTSSSTSPSIRAAPGSTRLLGAPLRRRAASASAPALLWRRRFTHFYLHAARDAAPHRRDQPRCAAAHRHLAGADETGGWCSFPARDAEARVAALLARARRSCARRYRRRPSGLALAVQVLAGRRRRRRSSTASPPTAGPSCSPARRTPAERALVDAVRAATRAPVVDLAGAAHAAGTRGADRRRAPLLRRRLGADAHGRRDGHADGRAVRPERRRRVGAVAASPHRVVASTAHPCRPCGNNGCGGSNHSDCLTDAARSPRAPRRIEDLLAETGSTSPQ